MQTENEKEKTIIAVLYLFDDVYSIFINSKTTNNANWAPDSVLGQLQLIQLGSWKLTGTGKKQTENVL